MTDLDRLLDAPLSRYAHRTARTWAEELIIARLAHVVAEGLHPVYAGDTRAWLLDVLVGDMPWYPRDADRVTLAVITHPRFVELNAAFSERFGVSFYDELTTDDSGMAAGQLASYATDLGRLVLSHA